MVSNNKNNADENLTFAEKDVLKGLSKLGVLNVTLSPESSLVRALAAAAGQKHTGNIPSIITSLAAKGYLRRFGLYPPRAPRHHLKSIKFHVELKHHRSEIVQEGPPFSVYFRTGGDIGTVLS